MTNVRRLDGKRITVTGAAGGIGVPVVRRLREAGALVTGIDRVPCPECDVSLLAELASDEDLTAVSEQLSRETPDILVNIAGVMRFGLHEGQPPEALALCYRVNLLVPAVLARAVAGSMRARGSGQIVNVGSVLGAIPYPWFAAYSSSKAGLAALSQALRRELQDSGVTVSHINPRAVRTPFNNAEVNHFLTVAGMKADEPDAVADRIVAAILGQRSTVSIGAAERVFAALNALSPPLIDRGLASQIRRLRAAMSNNS